MATGKPNNDVGGKLLKKSEAANKAPAKTFAMALESLKPQLAMALPEATNLTADRLCRLVLTEMRNNPLLAQCDRTTVYGAMMRSAALGLEIGLEGRAYLVPYKNRNRNCYECQFIIGYRGELELVKRSGATIGIPKVRLVYENDIMDLKFTSEKDELTHIPWHIRKDESFTEPGRLIGGYLIVRYKAGGDDFFYYPMYEILKRRERSKAKDQGPWRTDFEAMVMKTIVRMSYVWLPASVEKSGSIDADGKVSVFDPEAAQDISEITSRAIEVDSTDFEEEPGGDSHKQQEPGDDDEFPADKK